jgi:hypothetical protein
MARTAAIVGTATATRNAVNRRQADKNMAAYQQAVESNSPQQQVVYAEPPPQQVVYAAPPVQEAAPPPMQEDVITQLERLGALKAQGLLTEEEFAAQKAKLLGL